MGRRDGHGHASYARSHCSALRNGESCEPCEDALERQRMMEPRLPVAPLRLVLPRADRNGRFGYDRMGGVSSLLSEAKQRGLYRALEQGLISEAQADTFAIVFGYHPAEIWGRAYDDPNYYADQLELNSPEFRSLEMA